MSIKDTAKAFAETHGLKIFPLKGKTPFIKGVSWQEYASTDANSFSDDSWDYATGYGVVLDGVTVLDVDSRNLKKMELPALERTLIVQTRSGFHFYYKGETQSLNLRSKGIPIDVKSGPGAYVVGPGSFHEAGITYLTSSQSRPDMADLALETFEQWTSSLGVGTSIRERLEDSPIFREGERNVGLIRTLGAIARYNFHQYVLETAAIAINETHCDPPLPHEEVIKCVESAQKTFAHSVDLQELTSPDQEFERLMENEMSAQQLIGMEAPESIIEGLWPMGAISVFAAASGSYKSFIALDLAARIADGRDVIEDDIRVPKARSVLYVIGEGVLNYGKRLLAAELANTSMRFQPVAVNLSDESKWYGLCDYIAKRGFEVVVLDTLQKCRGDMNENDAGDVSKLYKRMETLHEYLAERGTPVSFMLVHHSGKNLDWPYRGSSALVADATNAWTLTDKDEDAFTVVLRSTKIRDLEPVELQVYLQKDYDIDSLWVHEYSRDLADDVDLEVPLARAEDIKQIIDQIDEEKDADGRSKLDYLRSKQYFISLVKDIVEVSYIPPADIRDLITELANIKPFKLRHPETDTWITRWGRYNDPSLL